MDNTFVEAIRDISRATVKTEILNINERAYVNKDLRRIKPPTPAKLSVTSLTALANYCETQLEDDSRYIIHIEDHETVSLYTELNNIEKTREHLVQADFNYKGFPFGNALPPEMFIISMQTMFIDTEIRKNILSIIGKMSMDSQATLDDDGVSQHVTVKKGISLKDNKKIPNPVILAPFRTFMEVSQPVSPFVLRITDGLDCALFGADGDIWKIEAVDCIREFFNSFKFKNVSIIG